MSGEQEDKLVRTKEVLERSEISRQVLYRYIQMDLITPVKTTETGRNLFSPRVFRAIELIERLKDRGYTLRDIKEIFSRRMSERQRDLD